MDPVSVLLTLMISAAPVVELRGGIPWALARGLSPPMALGLAVAGNLAVVPVVLWGLERLERRLMQWRWSRRLLTWVFARSRRKGQWIHRLGPIGLILLVALPFPGTGAWTGSVAARLLGLPRRKALLWIGLGVLLAAGLVLSASLGIIKLFGVAS